VVWWRGGRAEAHLGCGWHILWWFEMCGTKWNPRTCASETRTPRKSTRGARGQGRSSITTHQGTVVSKRRHVLSSSSIGSSRSSAYLPSRGHHRPAIIIRLRAVPRLCSIVHHGATTSSSGSSIGGTTSSVDGALGGPPPSSTGGGNRATSSSVSIYNMASGASSQRSGALISGLVVTAASRCSSRNSRMKICLLFIWSYWIQQLLLFFLVRCWFSHCVAVIVYSGQTENYKPDFHMCSSGI
jgi:hypothetical protein